MIHIEAPNRPEYPAKVATLFLAGSIEMGTAQDWQSKVIAELSGTDVVIFNPRRKDWDSSWEQSINNKQFKEQVDWEQDRLSESDIHLFVFDKDTKSPITLLELGYSLAEPQTRRTVIVCCPKGFWRRGNVEIMCHRANETIHGPIVVFCETLKDAISMTKMAIFLPPAKFLDLRG